MIDLLKRPTYTLQIPPIFDNGKGGKRKNIPAIAIVEILQRQFGDGLKDVSLVEEGRSVYCKAKTTQGDKFVKVFYERRNPQKRYKLMEKVYAEAGKEFPAHVIKFSKSIYLSITPWVDGVPLTNICDDITKTEQRLAGEEVGKALKDIHRVRDYKDYGVKKESIKKQVCKAYLCLKLIKEKDYDAWRLYKFIKAHYKRLEKCFVLCHGDMHANNVLCNREKGAYTLIDYDSMTACSPYIDIAPLMFLPKSLAPFVKSVAEVLFSEEIDELSLATAVALYGLTHIQFNGTFVKRAIEIIDGLER